MTDAAQRSMRVLVALTGACRKCLPLDACRELAADAALELFALFVEDRALLLHAESRLAREIVLSGLERRLDVTGVERQLRARSAALRRDFEADAKRLGLVHAFDVVRGDPVQALHRAVERANALVADRTMASEALAVWSHAARRSTDEGTALHALLLVTEAAPRSGEIVAIASRPEDAAPAPGGLLDSVIRMAERSGSPLTVLLAAEAAAGGVRAQEAMARAASAHGVELTLARLESRLDAAALAAAGRRARLLVLGPPRSLDEALTLVLLRHLRASLMLLRDR